MWEAGLEGDSAAIPAALSQPWRSGQADGGINRTTMLKRHGHRRASLDPLRRRVLVAA